ncbi:type II toxin-antitoxin system ParD family antitoxin [Romeria aff. gracilis LEGE 07310]|uniref:Type II toxin-antitoxin system ParD family antitoxin n=1 Tax=Vasconcelosia minhoensis LEGE 07310 TaxID=915328 RepID=A0A8J7AJT9_9CYAN|nr:type II toxin-antitoxin system ParD family antitoxin [Romeria gracilis]MBE9078913.1 type II toxin-antitoxin system ParD family antitoxin [Romeria aff. gracilis LEGE 07310]
MEITLKPEQAKFIQTQVTRGRYANPNEVVSRALKLLQEWEQEYEQWLAETRQKVEVGAAQAQAGEVLDLEAVTERLRARVIKAQDTEG